MVISPPLTATLTMLADAMSVTQDRWWIIGSAAVAMHGGEVSDGRDIDLLMSQRDAKAFLQSVGVPWGRGEPSDRFYSPVFGVWDALPLPIEAFGGFRVANDGVWRAVSFSSRETIDVGGATLYAPSAAELIDLLHTIGRPKDLQRASLLRS